MTNEVQIWREKEVAVYEHSGKDELEMVIGGTGSWSFPAAMKISVLGLALCVARMLPTDRANFIRLYLSGVNFLRKGGRENSKTQTHRK